MSGVRSDEARSGTRSAARAVDRAAPFEPVELARALAEIADTAAERDARPAFPDAPFRRLGEVGALGATVAPDGGRGTTFEREWSLVRAVARSDGAVGRIFDGHLNAIERLQVHGGAAMRTDILAAARGALLLGVWGADPVGEEGEPARLSPDRRRLDGAKVFCSGAGGIDRALVLARDTSGAGPPLLAYVDLANGVDVDRGWYQGAGMRASESHRVVFDGARVIAVLGGPGQLGSEPWFSRDAIRTAATWAGVADAALDAALSELAARGRTSDIEALAAGRMRTALGSIDAWLERAARLADGDRSRSLAELSVMLRAALADACGALLDEAVRACGARPLGRGGALDRARRDLGIFLLQHRLDPLLARVGRGAIEEAR